MTRRPHRGVVQVDDPPGAGLEEGVEPRPCAFVEPRPESSQVVCERLPPPVPVHEPEEPALPVDGEARA